MQQGLKTYPENKELSSGKAAVTWILVADAREATLYNCKRNADTRPQLSPITGTLQAENIEFQSEPGRSHESATSARHALAPHTDPKEDSRKTFVHDVLKKLEASYQAHDFNRLVILAPAKVLGDLRNGMSSSLHKTVIAEAAKELKNMSTSQLADYLQTNDLL